MKNVKLSHRKSKKKEMSNLKIDRKEKKTNLFLDYHCASRVRPTTLPGVVLPHVGITSSRHLPLQLTYPGTLVQVAALISSSDQGRHGRCSFYFSLCKSRRVLRDNVTQQHYTRHIVTYFALLTAPPWSSTRGIETGFILIWLWPSLQMSRCPSLQRSVNPLSSHLLCHLWLLVCSAALL